MAKLWSLQVMRFVAALLVAHFHAMNFIQEQTHQAGVLGAQVASIGRCGVDLFFVLSGFIITRTSGGLTAGQFLERRAKRVLPLYLSLALATFGVAAARGAVDWREGLATLTLWPATDRMTAPLIPVAWTLSFELLFYMAAALVIWRPRTVWLLALAYVAAMISHANPVLQFLGNPMSLEFLLGVGLAYLPAWRPAMFALPLGVAGLIATALFNLSPVGSVIDLLTGEGAWVRFLTLGLPSALVVWGTLQINARQGILTRLGDASYCHYLFHAAIVVAVAETLIRLVALPPDIIALACVTVSVLATWGLYEFVERPLLAMLRRPPSSESLA